MKRLSEGLVLLLLFSGALPLDGQGTPTAINNRTADPYGTIRRPAPRRNPAQIVNVISPTVLSSAANLDMPGGTAIGRSRPAVFPVVVTVTVAVEDEVPLTVVEFGNTEQLVSWGHHCN